MGNRQLQQVRLALALIIFHPPPLLLLDEITTHVDFATVQALARALKRFTGAIVLITHDRWFSRVVIERESVRDASGELDAGAADSDGGDASSSSDDDEDGEDSGGGGARPRGRTYRVGNGKLKLMEKGMQGYVGIVERKLERRRRELEALQA